MPKKRGSSGLTEGVVTFLDVLGWRGIYQRNQNALKHLRSLVDAIRGQIRGADAHLGRDAVKSISDTIAIFTTAQRGELARVLEIHGQVCARAVVRSIQLGIPVRGATSFGEYEVDENIFIGKAVDEAAAWYESGDWMGVHLTPSALFAETLGADSIWVSYAPPMNQRSGWRSKCVDWSGAWMEETQNGGLSAMEAIFRTMGPITPETAGKYTNTLDFLRKMLERSRPQPEDAS